MDHKFQIGDLVEAVEAKSGTVVGEVYEVVDTGYIGMLELLYVKNKYGASYNGIYAKRFKLFKANMNKRTYNIGDKVVIQSCPNHFKGDWTRQMDKYIGKEYTIIKKHEYKKDCFCFDNNFYFHSDCFKKVGLTYTYWYNEAKRLNIAGRSKLNKKGLEDAVNKRLNEDREAADLLAKKKAEEAQRIKEEKEKAAKELARKKKEEDAKRPLGEVLTEQVADIDYPCSFALQYEDFHRNVLKSYSCHAFLGYGKDAGYGNLTTNHGNITQVVFCLSGHYKASKEPATYKEWIDYMINRSPWSNAFITKDVEEGLKSGFYGNVEESLSRLSCSAIQMRQASEFGGVIETFKFIKANGFSDNVACFMTIGIRKGANGWVNYSMDGGHTCFIGLHNLEQVVKFFKEGWHRPTDKPFKDNLGGYKIQNSIAQQSTPDLYSFFKKYCIPTVTGAGWDRVEKLDDKSVLACAEAVKALID